MDEEVASPEAVAAPPPQIDELVKKYIALRDKKAKLKKDYDASVESIDKVLEKCEALFATQMRQLGLEQLPTQYGTPYKKNHVSVTVANREEFLKFARENDLWDLIDVRAAKENIEQWSKDNADFPPGLNRREVTIINVKRK